MTPRAVVRPGVLTSCFSMIIRMQQASSMLHLSLRKFGKFGKFGKFDAGPAARRWPGNGRRARAGTSHLPLQARSGEAMGPGVEGVSRHTTAEGCKGYKTLQRGCLRGQPRAMPQSVAGLSTGFDSGAGFLAVEGRNVRNR